MLRRHTGLRLPPGYLVYGLDTYQRLWCERIGRFFAGPFQPVAETVQSGVRLAAGLVIGHTIRESQGLSSDGWAGRVLRYMLPPGYGPLFIEGVVPGWGPLRGQKLQIEANGSCLGDFDIPCGAFQLAVKVPTEMEGQLLQLKIRASRWAVPGRFTLRGDRRRLAYRFKSIRWAQPQKPAASRAVPVFAGQ
jgi:hypothetical protein